MGLNVGKLTSEKLAGALNCNFLSDINVLTAAVITVSGIALSVLICKHGAHSRHNLRRHEVFRGDKLNVFALTLELKRHSVCNFLIGFGNLCD